MTDQNPTTERQLKELILVMEKQNVLLAQLLSFIHPITDFFKAFNLVVKVVMGAAATFGILWGLIQAAKEYIKTHP